MLVEKNFEPLETILQAYKVRLKTNQTMKEWHPNPIVDRIILGLFAKLS